MHRLVLFWGVGGGGDFYGFQKVLGEGGATVRHSSEITLQVAVEFDS